MTLKQKLEDCKKARIHILKINKKNQWSKKVYIYKGRWYKFRIFNKKFITVLTLDEHNKIINIRGFISNFEMVKNLYDIFGSNFYGEDKLYKIGGGYDNNYTYQIFSEKNYKYFG